MAQQGSPPWARFLESPDIRAYINLAPEMRAAIEVLLRADE